MINFLSLSSKTALEFFFRTKFWSTTVSRNSSRGVVRGIVNFQLVRVCGIWLIDRTFIPSDCCKRARKRYVSLEDFLKEISGSMSWSGTQFIDDLPF